MATPPDCALCSNPLRGAEARAGLCAACADKQPDEGVVVGRCFLCDGVVLHKMTSRSLLSHACRERSVAFFLDKAIPAPPAAKQEKD